MAWIEKEVDKNRTPELKAEILKEVEELDKIDPEKIKWEEVKE
jgi:hypothetical protein